jgi:hypothetical protein
MYWFVDATKAFKKISITLVHNIERGYWTAVAYDGEFKGRSEICLTKWGARMSAIRAYKRIIKSKATMITYKEGIDL